MNASNKIIFLYHFLMKRDRVSEAEMILYTYPKFKSQEQYGIKYNDIRYIGKWRQCQYCWVMVHLFNLFALDCNVLHLNVILVHVFALLTLLHHFLGGTCTLITVYGVFIMSKIDSKYGWGKTTGYFENNSQIPLWFGVFNLPATGAYIPFMRCLNSGGGWKGPGLILPCVTSK